MNILRRTISVRRVLATMVFAITVLGAQFAQVAPAHAAGGTATWTGATGDNKFSTAGNWSGNVLPVDGDILVLGEPTAGATGSPSLTATITNDLAINFSGISSTAVTAPATSMMYQFTNSVHLTAGATITLPSANGVSYYASAGIIGAGNLTASGANVQLSAGDTISGTLTIQSGAVAYPDVTGMTQLILDGGALDEDTVGTYPVPIHVVSPSDVYGYAASGTMTYSGAVTLDADLSVHVGSGQTVHFTGPVSGTGKIVLAAGQTGTLIVDAYAVKAPSSDPAPAVGAPNTSVASLATANPVVIIAAGIVAAAALFVATKRRA